MTPMHDHSPDLNTERRVSALRPNQVIYQHLLPLDIIEIMDMAAVTDIYSKDTQRYP